MAMEGRAMSQLVQRSAEATGNTPAIAAGARRFPCAMGGARAYCCKVTNDSLPIPDRWALAMTLATASNTAARSA